MPVSHIGLTVSHLPTSCSFFLSALQPLGYRYIGEHGSQIGLGINDADFFLCQETPSVKAGAAHIAFTAPSRSAVRDFYTAALIAGGRSNGAPASRTDNVDHFNAAILDLDGNSIEVVFRNAPDLRVDGTVIEHSRVITWRRTVSESYRDDRSIASARTSHTASRQTVAPASVAPTVVSNAPSVAPQAPSKAPSIASMASMATSAANMVRSVSAPVTVPQVTTSSSSTDNVTAKTLIGTLLGAAAGAAITYAMCKSEQDSARKEREFIAFMEAKAQQPQPVAQAIEQPKLSVQDPQPIYEAPPKSVHRNISDMSDTASQYLESQPHAVRAIEAAPSSYYAPSMYEAAPARSIVPARSVAPTHVEERQQIEYFPAYSIAPSRPQLTTAHRSHTSPELTTVSKAKSTVSKAHSHVPSSLISSYVPEQPVRQLTEGSIASLNSSNSKSRSKEKSPDSDSHVSKSRSKNRPSDSDSHVSKSRSKDRPSDSESHVSKHSSHSKHTSKTRSRAPSPPPVSIVEKAQSVIGSILGRDSKSTVSKKDDEDDEDLIDDFDFDEEYIEDGTDTVAPSDSISNAGSSSRRSHRSHKSSRKSTKDGSSSSEVSGHSSSSKDSRHSKSSKHSKHSHHTSSERKRSHHEGSSPLRESWSAEDDARSKVVSESSDVSTVKPLKSKSHRKDSLMAGQYDNLFNGAQYGSGSVAAMPIRGITPSMIDLNEAKKGSGNKSMINFALAQKLRAFEH